MQFQFEFDYIEKAEVRDGGQTAQMTIAGKDGRARHNQSRHGESRFIRYTASRSVQLDAYKSLDALRHTK